MRRYELAVKNGTLVIPYHGTAKADLGIRGGKISAINADIPASEAEEVLDCRDRLILPGAVDSHYHVGIYRSLGDDAQSESASSALGGVTSILSYFRTGHHYLNKSGPYRDIFPEVLELSRGRFYTDYGYHAGVMTAAQLDEVETLVEKQGVGSFKFYMFYKGLNLAADSTRGNDYTMTENYDLGHLYELMRRVQAVSVKHRNKGRIALSLHCENPELIRVFIEAVKRQGLKGLEAYSHARPPLTEHLSIAEAVILAEATGCPINLLHLSSREALAAAIDARHDHPELDISLEVTLHHLCLSYDGGSGVIGKVNPPIRTQQDADFLWEGIARGEVDTVVSDHACCLEEQKKEEDLWGSLPGFGGSALLYPLLLSEGFHRRQLPLTRIAELAAANPARAYGLFPRKGTFMVGGDADLAVIDLHRTQTVTADLLQSAQDFTPFSGMKVTGWPSATVLRGMLVCTDAKLNGRTGAGEYLLRPLGLHSKHDQERIAA